MKYVPAISILAGVLAVGCLGDQASSDQGHELEDDGTPRLSEDGYSGTFSQGGDLGDSDEPTPPDSDEPTPPDSDEDSPPLICPRPPANAIRVTFGCDSVYVESCKDLSNVVVEYADGTHQKFEGLTGTEGEFAGATEYDGAEIVRVWVKSGANHSGDGPGYGERFDAPSEHCGSSEPEAPSDDDPPSGDDETDDPDWDYVI